MLRYLVGCSDTNYGKKIRVAENTHFHGNNHFIEAIETENKVETLAMVDVGQQKVQMKLDTGAEISVYFPTVFIKNWLIEVRTLNFHQLMRT